MPDEKLIRSVLDMQKALDDRPYKQALDEIAGATRPMTETLREIAGVKPPMARSLTEVEENSGTGRPSAFRAIEERSGIAGMAATARLVEENSSIKLMLESVGLHRELARTALGPMWELRQAGILDVDSPWRREMELARHAMDGFDARFRLPETTETQRLLAEFRETAFSEILTRYSQQESSLKQAMEGMRTPWMDAHEAMWSMAGFAEMQGIGHALRSMPAFDESLSAALRLDLGDWRDPITWRPETFTNLEARSDFYVSRGFNPALTDFPLPAFEEALDIAGLRGELPPLVEGDMRSVPPKVAGEEKGLARTNAAHDRLQRLERLLRNFIEEQMTRVFGTDWPKHRLPNGLYELWQDKKRKAEQAGAEERSLVEYADFMDYALLICRTDNWREVFAPFFNRPESVRESFQRLHPIRLDTMHARLITQDDELLLRVEVKRLVKAITKRLG